VRKIADKQFEILGLKMTFADIPESGVVTYTEGKKEKKDYWYNVYKFTPEQEQHWVNWALNELLKSIGDEGEVEKLFLEVNLRYGFPVRYTKQKELF